ncbi:accessory gene regulator ArgB-like protein [Lacrimispora sp. JR3]|uniref:accessory gene regulator ArgB-like protein n=1 Tax=Lacrimispora sinapis TaxID=3111456 RepID=UPI0037495B58
MEKLISNHIIRKEEEEIYRFGMECLLLKTLHCISYLWIGACFHMMPELIVIGCVLIPLRRSAGGYHAKTKTGCYIFSCSYIFIILWLFQAGISQSLWWAALGIADLAVFVLSPADNENKRLDEKENQHYRKKARQILILANISCMVLTAFHFPYINSLVRSGIIGAAFLLILQKLLNAVTQKFPGKTVLYNKI